MPDSPKSLLRQQVLAQLKREDALPSQSIAGLAQRLLSSRLFAEAPAIVAYIAIQREIPLDEVLAGALRARKALYLPRYTADGVYALAEIHDLQSDLQLGHFRIPEPAPHCPEATALPPEALWLIPGIAFDKQGHRLGRGGGFYDRLLQRYPGGTPIGVCRDSQILEGIPTEPWDLPVHAILTPTRWISSRHDISSL